jgi:hypothetical protein
MTMAKDNDIPTTKFPSTVFLTGIGVDEDLDNCNIHKDLEDAELAETSIAEYRLVRVGVTSKQTVWKPAK